ncbi:hypothetical protein, partial [Anaerovibrio sp.]|uniref:hypothetical protein n=1 Tax=Anaerovibrio sp. TaxID=1872532 RepID=UPI00388DD3F5
KTVPSSGLNHVCMILVALFSFQRTPHSSFLSVALLLLAKLLDVPVFVRLRRFAASRLATTKNYFVYNLSQKLLLRESASI